MKKVLITGINSYVGESFKEFMSQWPEKYQINTIDTKTEEWKKISFNNYDSIFHVAGIAHVKETKENKELYYKVNRDIAVEIAKKAKAEGVKQFVFMSSMSVYGMKTGIITKHTLENPKTSYGDSKLQAEKLINSLMNKSFKVCILRPPMIYGKGCKGNFQTIIKILKRISIFPKVQNQRSMIYIDNFSNFVKKTIDKELSGVYYPQNSNYMSTSQMAIWIAEKINKKVYMSKMLGLGALLVKPFITLVKKAFGSLIYKDTEDFEYDYCIYSIEESVKKSV